MARVIPAMPTIHVISDSMGITARTIACSAASHFGDTDPNIESLSNVTSFEQIKNFLEKEQAKHLRLYNDDNIVVFYTLVVKELKEALDAYVDEHDNIFAVDVLTAPIHAIEEASGKLADPTPGDQHVVDEHYFHRIEALEFTIAHDDGLRMEDLSEADIVILGVSRTSKTPTSIYLGQRGYKVANVPLVVGVELPKSIYDVDRSRLFGLITTPEVLVGIRQSRMGKDLGKSRYASLESVFQELEHARTIMRGLGCVIINTKDRAIEETASEIIRHYEASFPRYPDLDIQAAL